VADDPTSAEIGRRLDAHELRTDRVHAELEAHINRVAAEMVPLAVYQADQRALAQLQAQAQREHDDDLRQLREDVIKPLTERITVLERLRTMGFGRWVGVLGVVAAFASVIVTAWATSKGAPH
jgi:hypothetical protein